ncbi:MAG TPA: hypothetical protein VGW80_04790 [Solirubrobacterales bacterium]|nr:hypothetical protein [Solirubrobacterales bacterium]
MSAAQTIVAAVLWIVILGLLALVLLLYRHVDRAYSGSEFGRSMGLMPGVEVPPLEIMTNDGSSVLRLPGEGEDPYLLSFINAECGGCVALLETLGEERVFKGVAIAILVQPVPVGHPVPEAPPNVHLHGAASPADVRRHFGITFVPLVYVMRGTKVLAAGGGATEAELKELLVTARENEAEVMMPPEKIEVTPRRMASSDA